MCGRIVVDSVKQVIEGMASDGHGAFRCGGNVWVRLFCAETDGGHDV